MLSDKEIKKKFLPIFWKNPEKYYATQVLKEEGFIRNTCEKCTKPFWNTNPDAKRCGDPSCSGGFRFIGNSPCKKALSYTEVWKEFSKMFEKLGYTPVRRYPVVSRWHPTMEFTNASIAAFQPYVISGEIQPPANPLTIPQFCLRFNDIDNVGITGSHNTGFVMIGQHMFVPPEKWDQNQVFRDIHTWLKKGLGLPNDELTFHEDAWAGGGNFGCCMEFFSRGVELGNQVYMLYEQTTLDSKGYRDLKLKVLDMGMGQERNAWFSQGVSTQYDATFPEVLKHVYTQTGVKQDQDIIKKFVPYSGYLNADEVENMSEAWSEVANKVGVDVDTLRSTVLPLQGVYSIAEHTRTLLAALNDGWLPSNVGGAHNLRVLYRRAMSFNDKYHWNLDFNKITELHARGLKSQYPEFMENIQDVHIIMDIEKRKYQDTQKRTKEILKQVIEMDLTPDALVALYDTQGISPEIVQEEAKKAGKKVIVPDNFYALVAEKHEKVEQQTETHKKEVPHLEDLPSTQCLYFDHYDYVDFEARVLKVIGKYVILDRTAFYPTSGGQLHDIGTLNKHQVVEVFKQNAIVVHELEKKVDFKVGEKVLGKIDFDRRLQLAQHHTSTHLINGVCKNLLGNHIWQAGAAKFEDKARLDITHYENLTEEQVKQIEEEANKIIQENRPVYKSFMPRAVAEAKYGFTIYQGGVAPGKELRIVNIEGLDVEACGGTHLDLTGEAREIKILKTFKVQDGLVRIEFVAGKAAVNIFKKEKGLLEELADLLKCSNNQIPGRLEELFTKWKAVTKKGKKLSTEELRLASIEEYKGEVIPKACEILKTQPEHLIKTVKRFLEESHVKA
ncbi:MAG TPA: alanine--tRNA ligase [Candidatus Nanoarchaeia archaeon]|nr:alanine--tRNA ligase [Candidatus Nanoarchaeia archaeon]